MKTTTTLVMGGAILAAAASQVHAQPNLPSTGDSQLLFVLDNVSTEQAYVAVITGEDIIINSAGASGTGILTQNQVLASAQNAGSGIYNGLSTPDAAFSVDLGADSSLGSFYSSTNGDTYQWALIGSAYNSSGQKPVGNTLAVVTTPSPATLFNAKVSGLVSATGYVSGVAGYQADIESLQSNTFTSFSPATGQSFASTEPNGLIGTTNSADESFNFYGANIAMNGLAVGTSAGLYGLSSTGGTAGDPYIYNIGTVLFNGTELTFTPATVPLPAAVWLLGGGLLGLVGIGRRRAAISA